MMSPGWYLRRLSRMGPREIAGRGVSAARRRRWRGSLDEPVTWLPKREFTAKLPDGIMAMVPADAEANLLAAADRLMDGYGEYFGVIRDDMVSPDWSFDPRTGRQAPTDEFAFDIAYRDEEAVGDIKQIWEPSRHQHLTVLATAYALTGDDRYAARVADQLKSWWAANPPLRGVHWVSGIELGIRLLSWVWVRRLLDGWVGAPGLFEQNPEALHQIWHHQRWLAGLRSHGSSANNHVIAEDAGLLAASSAFPWFAESPRWRADSMRSLDEQLARNTFASGLNRELATEYHGLVLELGLAAAIEADTSGFPVPDSTWDVLQRMTDTLAAIVDVRLRPPRQGDADDGYGLVVDGAETNRWSSLLATGNAVFGRRDWWPEPIGGDVRTPLLASLARRTGSATTTTRPARRPVHLADAGMTILRAEADESSSEIWCRCDGGPHGFLSIAAHAHADALSVEVRHGGVDILADPGTFCYHGEPEWRSYFRSTLGHNTLELDEQDQSVTGGPFMWTRHARTTVLDVHTPANGPARWSAEHDGYAQRPSSSVHRRSVELDDVSRQLTIVDDVLGTGKHQCRLAFHLGPAVELELDSHQARLTWVDEELKHRAVLELPAQLSWRAHRGQDSPPLGWYSAGFGRKEPAYTLVGSGLADGATTLTTLLRFNS
jgi:hypothetical protein